MGLLVILFFMIYSIKFPFGNSTYWSLIILLIASFKNIKYFNFIIPAFFNKKILHLFLCIIFLTIISLVVPVTHGTYDFSLVKSWVNIIIYFITCFLWVVLYLPSGKDINDLLRSLVLVNVLQAIIMLFAFIIPEMRDAILNMQPEAMIEIIDQNLFGLRGLALSGTLFFGLSFLFSCATIINSYLFLYDDKNRNIYYIFFIFLSLGSILAGRTAVIGLVYAGFFLLYSSIREMKWGPIIYILKLTIVFLLIIQCFIFFGIGAEYQETFTDKIVPYAFEFAYKYFDDGVVETSSTNTLFTMYYPISWETFVFGDARWANGDGYYGDTDAGYMRNILFMGIGGMLLLLYYLWLIVSNIRKQSRFFMGNIGRLSIALMIWTLICHIKGEVLGYPFHSMTYYFIIFIYVILASKYKLWSQGGNIKSEMEISDKDRTEAGGSNNEQYKKE